MFANIFEMGKCGESERPEKMGKFLVEDAIGTSGRDVAKTAGEESQNDSDIPSDIIFPDQLNRYFQGQIHSLTLENGALRRSLEETQEELSATKEKLTKASQPAPSGRVAEAADFRIAQLSKRLREQNAEMESLRTQAREAEAKLRRLEDKSSDREIVLPESPDELAEKERQIKILTEKLHASNAKMCDFRNQYQALKQEMKIAQKVIESEVGEKCSLQDLAKENGNWRGRAQMILALQNKVQMLQEQLNNTNGTENPASSVLRQIEKDRRASYEETSKRLNQKTIQMEDLKKKFEAAKARNRVLETEMIQIKTKLSALNEKGTRDEHLLSALTTQINAFEDRGKAQMHCFSKMQENMNKLQQELELERTKGEQLQRALSDREARIHRMEQQIEELRKNLKNKNPVGIDDVGTNSTADKSTFAALSPDRVKSVADTDRMRLLELVSVINTRLDEARREQTEVESLLRKERYKNAKLQNKVAKLELEKVGAIKAARGSYGHGIGKIGDSTNLEADISAQQHIEYLEEECLALKTRIETLQMEKEADLKLFACAGDVKECGTTEFYGDGKYPRSLESPAEKTQNKKDFERKTRLNGRKIHRSPANTICSASIRESPYSSEDFKYYGKTEKKMILP